jgi:hypothetical protein
MTTPAPPPPHPLQARLAQALLRKAARSQGGRAASLALDAHTLPELHHATTPEALAHVALLVEQLQHTSWVSLKLKPARAFDTLADRQPTLVLRNAQALAAWVGFAPEPPKWSRQMVAALREPGVLNVPDAPALLDYLLRNPLPWFESLSSGDCAQVLNALSAACAAPPSTPTLHLRELSALHFHGHSKVLDNRDELLRLLGAREGQFPEAPIQLLISLPPPGHAQTTFGDVLFIENLISFERMATHRQAAWAHTALVFASGFKGTARRLRQANGASLYWRDAPSADATEAWRQWLHDDTPPGLPVSFYGDLDFAGMQILGQLRQGFPNCTAWRPGDAALTDVLLAGQGHAPQRAGKEAQTDPGLTGCPHADQVLLPLLRQSGCCMDQERWPANLRPMA